jgi:hypothetical protein
LSRIPDNDQFGYKPQRHTDQSTHENNAAALHNSLEGLVHNFRHATS